MEGVSPTPFLQSGGIVAARFELVRSCRKVYYLFHFVELRWGEDRYGTPGARTYCRFLAVEIVTSRDVGVATFLHPSFHGR